MQPKRDTKTLRKSANIHETSTEDLVIRCSFPYSIPYLDEIRKIAGRKWYKKDKYWTIPLSLENAFLLKKLNYTIRHELREWANDRYLQETQPIKPVHVTGLKGKLFKYQEEGVSFINHYKGCGLIADEMGLGKTIQAIAYLQLHPETRPAVIVCPASLKYNWKKEIENWMPKHNIQILSGTKPDRTFSTDIIIINYDIVTYWKSALKWLKPKIMILDESHYIKNSSAKRTKAILSLKKAVDHVICLSGTPIESKPAELFNTIKLIDPTVFPDKWKFLKTYCGAKHNGFGWDFSGATKTKELHGILTKKVMIRRLKKDVLKDLPEKTYSFVPLEIDNRKVYDEAEDDFIKYVRDGVEIQTKEFIKKLFETEEFAFMNKDVVTIHNDKLDKLKDEAEEKISPLVQIEILKQLAVRGKMKSIIKWIENFLESGEKLVVYAIHKFVIEELMSHFNKIAVKIDGSVPQKKRHLIVESFQTNDKIRLFIGNIKAAGVGITLTAASNVAFTEYPWKPSDISQPADRCHRIGQKFTVGIHYLLALGTIEEKIAELLDKKQKIVSAVLDGQTVQEEELFTELINSYKLK